MCLYCLFIITLYLVRFGPYSDIVYLASATNICRFMIAVKERVIKIQTSFVWRFFLFLRFFGLLFNLHHLKLILTQKFHVKSLDLAFL